MTNSNIKIELDPTTTTTLVKQGPAPTVQTQIASPETTWRDTSHDGQVTTDSNGAGLIPPDTTINIPTTTQAPTTTTEISVPPKDSNLKIAGHDALGAGVIGTAALVTAAVAGRVGKSISRKK